MIELVALIVHADPVSCLAWLVLAFAAGMYPLGFMLGSSCSQCCAVSSNCLKVDQGATTYFRCTSGQCSSASLQATAGVPAISYGVSGSYFFFRIGTAEYRRTGGAINLCGGQTTFLASEQVSGSPLQPVTITPIGSYTQEDNCVAGLSACAPRHVCSVNDGLSPPSEVTVSLAPYNASRSEVWRLGNYSGSGWTTYSASVTLAFQGGTYSLLRMWDLPNEYAYSYSSASVSITLKIAGPQCFGVRGSTPTYESPSHYRVYQATVSVMAEGKRTTSGFSGAVSSSGWADKQMGGCPPSCYTTGPTFGSCYQDYEQNVFCSLLGSATVFENNEASLSSDAIVFSARSISFNFPANPVIQGYQVSRPTGCSSGAGCDEKCVPGFGSFVDSATAIQAQASTLSLISCASAPSPATQPPTGASIGNAPTAVLTLDGSKSIYKLGDTIRVLATFAQTAVACGEVSLLVDIGSPNGPDVGGAGPKIRTFAINRAASNLRQLAFDYTLVSSDGGFGTGNVRRDGVLRVESLVVPAGAKITNGAENLGIFGPTTISIGQSFLNNYVDATPQPTPQLILGQNLNAQGRVIATRDNILQPLRVRFVVAEPGQPATNAVSPMLVTLLRGTTVHGTAAAAAVGYGQWSLPNGVTATGWLFVLDASSFSSILATSVTAQFSDSANVSTSNAVSVRLA